ncbi:glycolate oxidase subunit GlcE [Marinobacter xestospongiae]|uniref:Glycolate oxidase subunit GlcE n=1 Tax=Marinobacter xestospongiae TaxID=994319 RepID=A0ABU3W1U5_9GAMM|nr:glycolate oxidase subunit GlcE [Marinobacter xestospongiae]MDV2080518.1 glycolate oxidase subunit GlcE [Marinobacter xestospongiae]
MTDRSEQLLEQVLAAKAAGQPLRIVGGNSKAFLGRQADAESQDLNVGEHRGIVEYNPVELVLTARAGTPLREIEAALAEHGQALHFEPPHFGDSDTLGGTLAANLSGPARPWSGSVRDQVLGIRLINGNGEHLRFGGQVMKNVAGYDVSRLQAGALGTLGVMTEISLKVMPRPAASLTLVREMSAQQAIQQMNARAAEPKPLTAACWQGGRMYLRLAGAQSAVEATAAKWGGEVLDQADGFWRSLQDQQLDYFKGEAPLWRFSVRANAALAPLPGAWLLDWAGAQRWYRGDAEQPQLEQLAREAGGQVSLFRGGDRSGEVMHHQPQALAGLQTRMKQAFDPHGLFNPGRLYSWL